MQRLKADGFCFEGERYAGSVAREHMRRKPETKYRLSSARTCDGESRHEHENHRPDYAAQYGPTTGDKIHLADTGLVAEIEDDFTTYGDELVFGGGKTIRDGMGQASKWKASDGALDLVVTNAVIIDPMLGVIKADIGIKDGMIVGVGKSGNPDTMNITPGLIVSPNTDILSVEGMIVTPGLY